MTVSAKDLRFKISMLFDMLTRGEEITITYRGKPKARLIPYDDLASEPRSDGLFGMWQDREFDVDTHVRTQREGRRFDL